VNESDDLVARTTVSIDPRVMRIAKTRMRALGIRKFSQYVALLLEKDQREAGPLIVVKEDSTKYPARKKKK
jgi:hypothetical protein